MGGLFDNAVQSIQLGVEGYRANRLKPVFSDSVHIRTSHGFIGSYADGKASNIVTISAKGLFNAF